MKRPLKATTHHESPRSSEKTTRLLTVSQIVNLHAGLSAGGIRHMIFHQGPELEEQGVIVRFGRCILFDEVRFLEWLRAGRARWISGSETPSAPGVTTRLPRAPR